MTETNAGTHNATIENAEETQGRVEIAVFLHDGVTALDAIGPYEMLRAIPGGQVKFVAKTPGPVRTDSGFLSLVADYSLDEVPQPDVLLVPAVADSAMSDEHILSWVRSAHQTSQWTTSVCGGSLLLGAAGLLEGLRATGHWATEEAFEDFGATFSHERYVQQGKIITAAGVSAGIDMGLYLVGEIAGETHAQVTQLMTEYDPEPPFNAGSLAKASPEIVDLAHMSLAQMINES